MTSLRDLRRSCRETRAGKPLLGSATGPASTTATSRWTNSGSRAGRSSAMLLIFLTVVVLASRAARSIGDPDLWWHLRLGNDLITQGSLAAPGHWSPFATRAWTPTEPFFEIVSAELERHFGLPGVAWLYGVGLVGLVPAIYFMVRRHTDPWSASVLTILAVLGCSMSLAPRPQLVSFALLPIVLSTWFKTELDLRPRWWLVPLTWAWSLMHGFWFIGIAYGFLFVVIMAVRRTADARRLGQLALVPLLSLGVVLLNPAGIGVIDAPFAVHDYGKWVAEWQHPNPAGSIASIAVELMLIETLALWVMNRQRLPLSRILLLCTAAFWCFYAVRTVSIASLVLAPLLAEAVTTMIATVKSRQASPPPIVDMVEKAAVGLWALVCVVALAFVVPHTSTHPRDVPTALDAELDALPAGTTVFNTYGIGGWITWRHPELHQVIDGLATPYPATYFDVFHAALDGKPGWRHFVRRIGASAALMTDDTAVIPKLRRHGWVLVDDEQGYTLLETESMVARLKRVSPGASQEAH